MSASYFNCREKPYDYFNYNHCNIIIALITRLDQTQTNIVVISIILSQECSPLVILHLGYIDYPSYVIVIRFHSLNLPKGIKINDIAFSVSDFTFSLNVLSHFDQGSQLPLLSHLKPSLKFQLSPP